MLEVNNLKGILARHKEMVSDLEKEISSIEATDLLGENQKLEAEISQLKEFFNREKADNQRLSEENKNLRNAVYEQLYNEKIQILNSTNKKLEVYFKSNIEGELNRLTYFEMTEKKRIDEMAGILQANRVNLQDEIYPRIYELRKLLEERVRAAREEILRNSKALNESRAAGFQKLQQERLTEEEIKGRIKQNNIESFIGLNIINKLGIFLLIIGIIAASQFTYFRLPDILKCIFTFVIGLVMLMAGEFFNRRKTNIFSIGLTSGGIAILYVGLALSYFNFNLLSMFPALGLTVLVTAGAFVLSQRYGSQTISCFAIIGGYLPILSIEGDKNIVYGAMVYFVLLNLLALVISVNKRWLVTAYMGFWLNVIGSIYILAIMFGGRTGNTGFSADDLISIAYIVLAFIIYTLIPVAGAYRYKLNFRTSDIVLLAKNTVISSILLYTVFYITGLEDFTGALAVAFAAVYIAMGRFTESFMEEERKARALFYITGLTFVALIIPFQFDKTWFSLGWLIEGTALLTYGTIRNVKGFKRAGTVITFLCLAAFILFDIPNYHSSLFVYKYLAVTAGSIVILSALLYKNEISAGSTKVYKYITLINIWFFSLYLLGVELKDYLYEPLLGSGFSLDYLINAAMILAGFIIAYLIPKINIIKDKVTEVISSVLYLIGVASLFILSFFSPVAGFLSNASRGTCILGTVEIAVISLLSLLAVREFIMKLVAKRKIGIELYPLIISLYFIVILTQNLIMQFNLGFNNALISVVYLVTALSWIIFGFIKKYVLIRRFGLGFCIMAVAKLFVIDLSFLTQGYRIVSYFIFGLTLLAISFVYQYFSRKINFVGEVMPDEKKNNT